MKVWALVVFENGDMTTSVWGVYDSKEKAEIARVETLNMEGINEGDYYLVVTVTEHVVE